MKVSNIRVMLTEKDLQTIINEVLVNYAKIPEIKIHKIIIKDHIVIVGNYSFKINIPFQLKISLLEVADNKITLLLQSANISKINISKTIRSYILKKVIKELHSVGITVISDVIKINLNKMCKVIPFVEFYLVSLNTVSGSLDVELNNFNFYSDKKEKLPKALSEGNAKKNHFIETNYDSIVNEGVYNLTNEKEVHSYSTLRKKLIARFPQKYKNLQDLILMMPDILTLLLRLYKDKRVKSEVKLTISIAIMYLLYPLDLLPDVIPFLGTLDDITITLFILNKIFCSVPKEIIMDNWEGNKNIVELVKKYVEGLSKIIGIDKLNRLIEFVSKLLYKGYKFFLS